MTLNDIQFAFNRAIRLTFSLPKFLLVFFTLLLCGVLAVFFRALATQANEWVVLSLLFVPLFLCAGILLAAGILLIRVYHDEVKGKEVSFLKTLFRSWELMVGAAYFSIPIILSYLILWMLLGIFMLFRTIPGVGEFFGAILSFAPFLINFLTLILSLTNFAILFFVTPILALRGLNRHLVAQILTRRCARDVFSNILLALISILPLALALVLLTLSAIITGTVCVNCTTTVYTVIEWFFVMIPFTALLAPPVVFFFNFAAESHVLLMREVRTR
jgi:hypothetical protein